MESANAIVNGTQLTFQAADTITGLGLNNSLNLVDTGSANWTLPAATVSGVNTVNMQNLTGTAAVPATTETSTVTFQSLAAGLTLSINGITVTSINAGASAADIATAFRTATTTGNASVSGTQSATWEVAAGNSLSSLVYTNATEGNQPNLEISGTAQSGLSQTISITNGTAVVTGNTLTFSYNGVSLTTAAIVGGSAAALKIAGAAALANAINAYAGSQIAKSDGVDSVTVVSGSPVSIGSFVINQAGGASAAGAFVNNGLAASVQTVTVTGGTTAETGKAASFTYNGVSLTTATFAMTATAADNAQTIAAAIATRINAYAGSTIASAASGVVTITNPNGAVIANLATTATGASIGSPSVTSTSVGYTAADPATQVTVEGVDAIAAATYSDTLDADNFVGATAFNSNKSQGAVIINDLTTQTIGKIGGSGDLTANFKSTATAATVNISDKSTAGNIAVDGSTSLKTVTLNSNGVSTNTVGTVTLGESTTALNINAAANLATGNITGFSGTTSKITVTGAASGIAATSTAAAKSAVTIGTIENTTVKTIDASAMTSGGVEATLNTNTEISFLGGQGSDRITTGAILGAAGLVDAGAGVDTLILAATNQLASTTVGARYKNFEILQVQNGVEGDLDFISGITAVNLNDGAGTTGLIDMSASQAANVTILAGDGAATLGVKNATTVGQIDTIIMTFNNGNTTLNEDINANSSTFTMAGVENIEVTAVDKADITQSATASAALNSVKLYGAGDIQFITGNIATTNFTIDGATATGKLTLNASSFATNGVSLVGGSGADTITGSDQADILKGNAGNDSLVGGDGADTIDGGAGNDAITGGAKADKMTGGDGVDTFTTGAAGDSIVASANTLAATISVGNTLTFANGLDIVTDFTVGNSGDLIKGMGTAAPTNLIGTTFTGTALTTGVAFVLYGSWNDTTKVFTAASVYDATSANDALIVEGDASLTAVNTTGYTLLQDIGGALVAGNFIA